MIRCIVGSLSPKSPRAGERWLALTAVAWGVWLLLPLNTFGAGLANTLLAQLATEELWGLLGVTWGALAYGASCGRWPRLRVLMHVVLTILWIFLAGVTMSVSAASSGVLYLMLGLHQAVYLYESILDWRGGVWKANRT